MSQPYTWHQTGVGDPCWVKSGSRKKYKGKTVYVETWFKGTVFSRGREWVRVKLDDGTGYVKRKYSELYKEPKA